MREAMDHVRSIRDKAREGGGKAALEKWKSRGEGKLGVRERSVFDTLGYKSAEAARVDALLDSGSAFVELSPLAAHECYPDPLPGAGLVTGIGLSPTFICGREPSS
jgi:3-methylcrotonyl-CoA carboxylase beta subunit